MTRQGLTGGSKLLMRFLRLEGAIASVANHVLFTRMAPRPSAAYRYQGY